jgi:hypothetical protein
MYLLCADCGLRFECLLVLLVLLLVLLVLVLLVLLVLLLLLFFVWFACVVDLKDKPFRLRNNAGEALDGRDWRRWLVFCFLLLREVAEIFRGPPGASKGET